MIWTDSIIDYRRTDAELEELIIFLIFVANKPADRTAYMLEKFLKGNLDHPFDYVREIIKNNELIDKLKEFKTGQYTRIGRSLTELVSKYTGNKLRTITRDELIQIHGIGMKSASCFVSWSQAKSNYCMLDTHLLKYLKDELNIENVPKGTPPRKRYLELEKIFLRHAEQLKTNPTELDLQIWRSYRI
jgi:thermostable 8-oxoguanine DNA glycosylase